MKHLSRIVSHRPHVFALGLGGLWLAGAVVLVANWPYTLLGIMPTNRRLISTAPDSADTATRSLLERWGRLHAVRSVLGTIATVLFLVAALRIGR